MYNVYIYMYMIMDKSLSSHPKLESRDFFLRSHSQKDRARDSSPTGITQLKFSWGTPNHPRIVAFHRKTRRSFGVPNVEKCRLLTHGVLCLQVCRVQTYFIPPWGYCDFFSSRWEEHAAKNTSSFRVREWFRISPVISTSLPSGELTKSC